MITAISRDFHIKEHLLIFGRYPVPGKTKTRLIPALGALGAADCHRGLTEKTVAIAREFAYQTNLSKRLQNADSTSFDESQGEIPLHGKSSSLIAKLGFIPRPLGRCNVFKDTPPLATGSFIRFYHEGGTPVQFENWLGTGINFQRQSDGDLGQRMRSAIADSFKMGASKVVIVGTDLPDLTINHFKDAFHALDSHDLVLGPSMDGGYWLIGMTNEGLNIVRASETLNIGRTKDRLNKNLYMKVSVMTCFVNTFMVRCGQKQNLAPAVPVIKNENERAKTEKSKDIFDDIDWSTERVLTQTLAAAKRFNIKTCQLELLNDLDTPDDLAAHNNKKEHPPVISIIIPTLNEAARIAKVVDSARHPNSEIIVVDGGSCDDTVKIAEKKGVRVITGARGRAMQQNLGAKAARADIVLFLHADTLLPTGYAQSVFMTFLDKSKIAGAFSFNTDSSDPILKLIALGVNIRSRWFKMPYGDQALFFRRSFFESAGGFPESPIAEDLMLIRNLFIKKRQNRNKFAILPLAVTTSARRWLSIGILRTTAINLIILSAIMVGVSPAKVAGLYGKRKG
ncbi:MAG: TIGR04283 family arsenosugar biosynthesis glycosyltransferase [Desulfamplus sp.]|nr:TIGR04283 family arsenosugar biosynthesis glycosyltransferase [Desulfamplus sp.]